MNYVRLIRIQKFQTNSRRYWPSKAITSKTKQKNEKNVVNICDLLITCSMSIQIFFRFSSIFCDEYFGSSIYLLFSIPFPSFHCSHCLLISFIQIHKNQIHFFVVVECHKFLEWEHKNKAINTKNIVNPVVTKLCLQSIKTKQQRQKQMIKPHRMIIIKCQNENVHFLREKQKNNPSIDLFRGFVSLFDNEFLLTTATVIYFLHLW